MPIKTELIPVIHMLDRNQVFRNVEICEEVGLNKVFLINHAVDEFDLMLCAYELKFTKPQLWIGVNSLTRTAKQAVLSTQVELEGRWTDYSVTPEVAELRTYKGQLFSGLAFKYQRQPKDLKAACEEAVKCTDVATTSGIGTGYAADLDKIKTIREYLGEHPIAIASGVNAKNVKDYVGIANYLLAASSFTDFNEIIVPDKLTAIVEQL